MKAGDVGHVNAVSGRGDQIGAGEASGLHDQVRRPDRGGRAIAAADGVAGGVARAFLGGAIAAVLAVLVAAAVWFTPSGRTPEATADLADLSDRGATA